jgi:endonuclease/exonuclease/phosphatase (EEP) superfamily protein YafD
MNWTKVQLTNDSCWIHLISCYLEGGEQTHQRQRAERVAEVIDDILRQDKLATIIVGGDFNNHLPLMKQQLKPHKFEQAINDGESTHLLGNQLDQVFVLNATVKNAILSNNYDRKITDHKVIKVDLDVGVRQINAQASDTTDATNVSVESLMATLK